MDNGIYIMLSRQMGLFRDMAVVASNVANVNTTGYQAERTLFAQHLMREGNIQAAKGGKMAFAEDVATLRNMTNGTMRQTGNSLDVAIQGEGYFQVETPLGVRYTRAGNFSLDGAGVLVTPDGYPVLDNGGQRITIDTEAGEVTVGEIGNMKQGTAEIANLGVVRFEHPQLLEHAGDTLLRADARPQPSENFRVSQGVLENANVQAVVEMTNMIDISRSVSTIAKYIEVMYDLQRKTSNTLAQQA